jgi:hypothetical protein
MVYIGSETPIFNDVWKVVDADDVPCWYDHALAGLQPVEGIHTLSLPRKYFPLHYIAKVVIDYREPEVNTMHCAKDAVKTLAEPLEWPGQICVNVRELFLSIHINKRD